MKFFHFSLTVFFLFAMKFAFAGFDKSRCVVIDGEPSAECGWWYGFIDKDEEYQKPKKRVPPAKKENNPLEEARKKDCSKEDEWSVECGFVDPGTSMSFQAKQRDALLEQAIMNPKSPEKVEAFQYYMKWAVDQSILVTKMWEWNKVQNHELDPNMSDPVSTFGLRLVSHVKKMDSDNVLRVIKEEGAFFVWFTRSDCYFCHNGANIMQMLEKDTGIPVWNASLDGECIGGFEDRCRVDDKVIPVATKLNVAIVPSLYLYIPKDDIWIKISHGVETVAKLKARVVTFFGGVTNAVATGLKNNENVPVDFKAGLNQDFEKYGLGSGVINK